MSTRKQTSTAAKGKTSKQVSNVMSSNAQLGQDAATNAAYAAKRRAEQQAKRDSISLYTGPSSVQASARNILEASADRAAINCSIDSKADYSAASEFAALIKAGGEEFAKKLMDEYSERPAYLSADLWQRWQAKYRRAIMAGVAVVSGNVVEITDLPIRNGKYYLELPMTPSLYARLVVKGDLPRAIEFGGAFGTQDAAMNAMGGMGERMPQVVAVYRLAALLRKEHAAIDKARKAVDADESDARAVKRLASAQADAAMYERALAVAWMRATAAAERYTAMARGAKLAETISALDAEILGTTNEDAKALLVAARDAAHKEYDAAMALCATSQQIEGSEDAALLASDAGQQVLNQVMDAPMEDAHIVA